MIIKLLPNQVPKLWDTIKYAATKVDRIEEKEIPLYLNKLLIALLNNKAQCFVRMSEQRELLAIAITRFAQDEITGEKVLFWNCLYSFKPVGDDQWETDWPIISNFAKKTGCKKITLYTNNRRVVELAAQRGFTERYRCYTLEV